MRPSHPIELLQPASLKLLSESLQSLVRGRLWLKVLIGMGLGVAMGVALGPSVGWVSIRMSSTVSNWLALPGQVFLKAIQMIVVPLVFASIIGGLASSDSIAQLKRLGIRSVLFFIATTALAIVVGICLAMEVNPGRFVDAELARHVLQTSIPPNAALVSPFQNHSLPEAIVGLIPTNPLGSMANSEMVSVVLFGVVIGVALVSLPPAQSEPLLSLLSSLQYVCMAVVRWTMELAPFAVFGLMAQLASKLGWQALAGMSVYVLTVLLGLAIMLAGYVSLVALLTRTPAWGFLKAVREVQLLAFSTSSSAAVMPLSIKTAEEKLGVRASVSQFVIPLGATINMNGTALYQAVATVFLAQVFGLTLNAGQLLLVVVTAVAASIGSPATPGVGIVILSMVLSSAGIPPAGIGLIIGVDRVLDMSRTAVNVTGDLVAAMILDRFAGDDLRPTEHGSKGGASTVPGR